jgi:nickel-dependent lactate racemase
MMRIRLAYGKNGLAVDLPDDRRVVVIEPRFLPGLPDPSAALLEALRHPMASRPVREQVRPTDKVGIIFSDITRATPHKLIIPAILKELENLPKDNIILFCALGTHRPNTDAELRSMLGDDLVDGFYIVQNNAFDPSTQVCTGITSRGHEIWLNRQVTECDLKILTGFIEPHFFAGFSAGGKLLMPGMAGQRTVLGNHDAQNIGHPNATWGVTQGNPIWEEVREVALQSGRIFLVNVTLNKDKEITGVFAGDLETAHAAGCEYVRQTAMVAVPEPFDIVITSNSGYPLDLNLYQAVKGMSAAAQVVKERGAIVVAAECWDGIPDHGLYGKLLREASSPKELLDRICSPGFLEQDQWQAQIQAKVQLKADVYVYSEYLSDDQIASALMKPCRSIEDTLSQLLDRYGPQATICVLPEGPQTILYIKE